MKDTTHLSINGFLKIYDPVSNIVFFDGNNAIHYENMSIVLARRLISNSGYIHRMAFGNGGTTVDPTGIITYLSPNNVGSNVSLYNQTYEKVIDSLSGQNVDTLRNYAQVRHVTGTTYTDIFITCLLDYGESISNQSAFDNATNPNDTTVFDELGLRAYSPTGTGRLLTHVIFHPVQKALNRLIQIDYTVRVQSLTGYNEV